MAMVSVTAREETASSAKQQALLPRGLLWLYAVLIGSNNPRWLKAPQKGMSFLATDLNSDTVYTKSSYCRLRVKHAV